MHLRIKLAALLSRFQHSEGSHLRDELARNIAGEVLTPQQARAAWLKLPRRNPADAIVVATPSLDPAEIDDAIARLLKVSSENEASTPFFSKNNFVSKQPEQASKSQLIFIGYGDGHLPIGIETMKERLLKSDSLESPKTKALWLRFIESVEAEGRQQGSSPDYSMSGLYTHLTRFLDGDAVQAKDLLRNKIVNSHPILKRIGNALDAGIDVRMATKLPYATTNLNNYEIGTILQFITSVRPLMQ
jgi:hypothetical protein